MNTLQLTLHVSPPSADGLWTVSATSMSEELGAIDWDFTGKDGTNLHKLKEKLKQTLDPENQLVEMNLMFDGDGEILTGANFKAKVEENIFTKDGSATTSTESDKDLVSSFGQMWTSSSSRFLSHLPSIDSPDAGQLTTRLPTLREAGVLAVVLGVFVWYAVVHRGGKDADTDKNQMMDDDIDEEYLLDV